MGSLHLNTHTLSTSSLHSINTPLKKILKPPINHFSFTTLKRFGIVRIRADSESDIAPIDDQEPNPTVSLAFVSSVLLPDGSPDVHYRTASGGKKLRDIMLDNNIELYGPYARALLNCAGGGTCATCMVEVVEGRDLLSPRTEKEKEKLKKKPKNWRLACQTTVGGPESRGLVVIQQLPEWKSHEWSYGGEEPLAEETKNK
ncbi:photosynthetic NDH subunit of subcomplex B 3, chloroplastic isoform X1 [Henckelia pumila]|uniref:photosynthetic NDH subunit of subcomplex B 3, chloroplastic isoform X1 n=2 Tax=Henckelia pumila TaxID=405737 RepID=UPI003C6DE916